MSTTMTLPISLPSLTPCEALADVVHRAVTGIDTPNKPLFVSAFTPDAVFDVAGTVVEGRDAVTAYVYDRIAQLDTTHLFTNLRVSLENGAATGTVTAMALGQHFRVGEGNAGGSARQFMTGVLYYVDCVRG
ncbi:Uu.00g106430.m01.CDS01 [Anthostomella pinea]|uniref:Uu.00g106430.m01.CDS01 n=1 Tax=Anthostomella pinea TaxID=933095 RepID=A0AAI8VEU3_9PEZI|nr:Uu.00g106430.m01.CDS01 [Anthostomella pinea]